MSEKRKDNKGRILRLGERQRSDGMYEFRYTDCDGNKCSAYSWTLVKTDKSPPGKRSTEPLRDIESRVLLDKKNGVKTARAPDTVDSLFDAFKRAKFGIKESTMRTYQYNYLKYARGVVGRLRACDVRYSTISRFYSDLVINDGINPNSLTMLNAVLYQIFEMALRDGLITSNPVKGVLSNVKRSLGSDKSKRRSLTVDEQKFFMKYIYEHPRIDMWKSMMVFMLGTGCRIGETIGLTWDDCDFENNTISINHNLLYLLQNDGSHKFVITTPKTSSGMRKIPMLEPVRNALLHQLERQKVHGGSRSVIDGYSNFVFTNSNRHVFIPTCVNEFIEQTRIKANKLYDCDIKHFSAHNLRHTFCTRMYESGVDSKIIQEIMGHSSIQTTIDIYTDVSDEIKQDAFVKLDAKIII